MIAKITATLGNECGDPLLRNIANRLRWLARAAATVACLGGDHFTIIMDSPPRATCLQSQLLLRETGCPADAPPAPVDSKSSIL